MSRLLRLVPRPALLRCLLALTGLTLPGPEPVAATPSGAPTRAAQQRALEQHERSVVQVRGPRRSGPGVFVGREGQVLTSVRYVSLDTGARVRHEGRELPAEVLKADGFLKFALVAAPEGSYPAAPVRVLEDVVGQWLIGVQPGRGKPRPVAVRARKAPAPFFDVGVALAPGSPLFDTQGRLVGLVVQRQAAGSRALPLAAVKGQLGAGGEAP